MRMSVSVRVDAYLYDFIKNTTQSDRIAHQKGSVLWNMIRPWLVTLPYNQTDSDSGLPMIHIEIPNTHPKTYSVISKQDYYIDTLFRCYLTKEGQALVRNFFNKNFKHSFHIFMEGYTAHSIVKQYNTQDILKGITEFCIKYNITITPKVLNMLRKDWYRYRIKARNEMPITY